MPRIEDEVKLDFADVLSESTFNLAFFSLLVVGVVFTCYPVYPIAFFEMLGSRAALHYCTVVRVYIYSSYMTQGTLTGNMTLPHLQFAPNDRR